MPRKVMPPVLLGSFSQEEANAIATILRTREDIHATIENLRVDSGATTWWTVHVPAATAKMASMWLSGYHAGREGRP
jgi:hypothetical protein